jgi:transcriptional regulator with XRE-family HTH domain
VSRQEYLRDFGKSLQHKRVDYGMTQAEVAAAIGCSPVSVSNWELGRTEPGAFAVKQLEAFWKRKAKEEAARGKAASR